MYCQRAGWLILNHDFFQIFFFTVWLNRDYCIVYMAELRSSAYLDNVN